MSKLFLAIFLPVLFLTLLPNNLVLGQVVNGQRVKLKEGVSTNWSGYAALTNLSSPANHVVTEVNGSWVVPTLTCTSSPTYSSVWVGIDGYTDSTVEQTGTEQDCSNGTPRYYAWYELYPHFPKQVRMVVKAGDSITAQVKYLGNNRFLLSLKDNTSGSSFSVIQKMNQALRRSAEWIVEAPSSSGGVLPLANFGQVTINNASAVISGVRGGINNSAWQNDPITMETTSGVVKASPSGLSSNGSSFSVSWNHN